MSSGARERVCWEQIKKILEKETFKTNETQMTSEKQSITKLLRSKWYIV